MKKLLFLIAAIALAATSPRLTAQNPVDFTLVSATDGSTFRLSDNKGKMVVLHFLLKTECPYCLKHTRSYAALSDSFPDIVQLFIKPDNREEILEWVKNLEQADFKDLPKIYIDPDARLASDYKIPNGYQFHGQVVHYPAMIILDGNGKEIFRYVGKNNSDRFPADKFITKVNGWK